MGRESVHTRTCDAPSCSIAKEEDAFQKNISTWFRLKVNVPLSVGMDFCSPGCLIEWATELAESAQVDTETETITAADVASVDSLV